MIDVSLFRIRAFNTALAVNFLAIFVAVGYFLFVAQYLQLVAGLSPLQAGLWSLPSAVAFTVASQLAPRIAHRVAPAHLVGGGLVLAAVGLLLLTQVDATGSLGALILGSVVISLGLAPVFGLTTELIVGSAPPERAGAASGISETGAELGGALGIAGLGSIGVALYRGQVADQLPSGLPTEVAAAAQDTLGAAVGAAAVLDDASAATVLQVTTRGVRRRDAGQRRGRRRHRRRCRRARAGRSAADGRCRRRGVRRGPVAGRRRTGAGRPARAGTGGLLMRRPCPVSPARPRFGS